MLTAEGPRLLEFNCRFGDPETQALMPLLDCDLAAVALACCTGTLADADLRIAPGSSCTVVAAAAGYPDDPLVGATVVDRGVDDDRSMVFPGALRDGRVAGGRVIAATGVGHTLAEARDAAYRRLERVHFNGMQVRGDIGWRAIGAGLHSYAAAGVDIEEGTRAVAEMKAAVEATHGPAVLGGVGSFGGSISLASLATMKEPVLVASTDGVGTKVELAARLGQRRGVGEDIVNHCINDVLVQGAVPLFFLDYIASSKLDATHVAEVVRGMADACSAAGCALLGGETAEMPGVYQPGSFDIAGTLVGVVDRPNLLPRPTIGVGDVLVGVESNGPHTNGYSFLRRLFEWLPMTATPDGFTMTLGETLLVPHRSYLPVLATAIDAGLVKGLAHITGGGLVENVPRLLPEGVGAQIRIGAWPLSPLWRLVRDAASGFDTDELYRTVNMGIGMVAVCAADTVADFQAAVAEQTWVIGELVRGERRVTLSR
jgi:phosphoribosylaminoimidazole synthetase